MNVYKAFLCIYFKVHVSKTSSVADHCRRFALSDTKDEDYKDICDHVHNGVCDRCDLVQQSVCDVEEAMSHVTTTTEELEELKFIVEQAKSSILAWKAHLLRSVNQDEARVDAVEELSKDSVLLVQDWAMKYLPRQYRESQTNWFAKRGIPWHVTVVIRRAPVSDVLETMTFVHIFPSCSQDSFTVLAIMGDVLKKLKKAMPNLENVFYRQDNAGCYHSASTIIGAKLQAEKPGVTLKRLDFSDPQGGKGACDRKAASIKSHMQIFLNEGHDIETASQMKTAIESSGGIPGVVVTLAESPQRQTGKNLTWDGVSFINNVEYNSEGMKVWKAYNIGPGKVVPWSKFNVCVDDQPSLIANHETEQNLNPQFVAVKPRKTADPSKAIAAEVEEDDGGSCGTDDDSGSKLFSCPEEGCTMSFQRYSSLEQHIQCGKHKRALEHETLLDRAMLTYTFALEKPRVSNIVIPAKEGFVTREHSSDAPGFSSYMGWALKTSFSRNTRFNSSQKDYLIKKFEIGEKTGRKLDPGTVAKDMRAAKDPNGKRLFNCNEFLTSQQIQSFFARLASKRTVDVITEEDKEEECSAHQEEELSRLRNEVSGAVTMPHPIMFDTYDICELASGGKLKSTFAVSVLRDICLALGIDVSQIMVKRKQPYIDALLELVNTCTCSSGQVNPTLK